MSKENSSAGGARKVAGVAALDVFVPIGYNREKNNSAFVLFNHLTIYKHGSLTNGKNRDLVSQAGN